MKNNKGFTLIEALLVLTLIAIISAIFMTVGPKALRNARYSSAVNKLLAEISYVKQLAARENRFFLFWFSSDEAVGNNYRIYKQPSIASFNIDLLVRSGSFLHKANDEFFDKTQAANYSFVVNSRGMAFRPGDIGTAGQTPSAIIINVFHRKRPGGPIEAQDTITIHPSGGVNVQ